jgi:hypothetical protein
VVYELRGRHDATLRFAPVPDDGCCDAALIQEDRFSPADDDHVALPGATTLA